MDLCYFNLWSYICWFIAYFWITSFTIWHIYICIDQPIRDISWQVLRFVLRFYGNFELSPDYFFLMCRNWISYRFEYYFIYTSIWLEDCCWSWCFYLLIRCASRPVFDLDGVRDIWLTQLLRLVYYVFELLGTFFVLMYGFRVIDLKLPTI